MTDRDADQEPTPAPASLDKIDTSDESATAPVTSKPSMLPVGFTQLSYGMQPASSMFSNGSSATSYYNPSPLPWFQAPSGPSFPSLSSGASGLQGVLDPRPAIMAQLSYGHIANLNGHANHAHSNDHTPGSSRTIGVKRRRKKEPGAPKRPVSAYLYFVAEQRTSSAAKSSNQSFGTFAKEIGARWRAMSEEERAPYHRSAAEDKLRFQRDKAAYKPGQAAPVCPKKKQKRPQTLQIEAIMGPSVPHRHHGESSIDDVGPESSFLRGENDHLPTVESQEAVVAKALEAGDVVDDPGVEEEQEGRTDECSPLSSTNEGFPTEDAVGTDSHDDAVTAELLLEDDERAESLL